MHIARRTAAEGVALAAALALSACAESGYVYSYNPYLGPTGHYVTLLRDPDIRGGRDCAGFEFTGPYYGGYRGPYYSGPYCMPTDPGPGWARPASDQMPGWDVP